MGKLKGLSNEEKIRNELVSLPNPLVDRKHGISIVLDNNRARSNESRFDHIISSRHELKPSDIRSIPKKIKNSIFRKDKERNDTYNIYIKRSNYSNEYIKICTEIHFEISNTAIIKTIYITKNLK